MLKRLVLLLLISVSFGGVFSARASGHDSIAWFDRPFELMPGGGFQPRLNVGESYVFDATASPMLYQIEAIEGPVVRVKDLLTGIESNLLPWQTQSLYRAQSAKGLYVLGLRVGHVMVLPETGERVELLRQYSDIQEHVLVRDVQSGRLSLVTTDDLLEGRRELKIEKAYRLAKDYIIQRCQNAF